MNNDFITNKNYEHYLGEIALLMEKDPKPGSLQFERLQLLSMVIQDYEEKKFLFDKPNAIDFIKFRMGEMGLNQSDLIPYIGSRSKVSEVLSGKRGLSISMMRSLKEHLNIPAEVLLMPNPKEEKISKSFSFDHKKMPLKEIVKKGWISKAYKNPENAITSFMAPVNGYTPSTYLWRKSSKSVDVDYNLVAWSIRVLTLSQKQSVNEYKDSKLDSSFLTEVARLSIFDNGPLLVKEFLNKNGIKFVIVDHLPKTKLDGGCFIDSDRSPVVALTLRYDRIDYFWYTLLHELAHVVKHLKGDVFSIIDNFDEKVISRIENEADELASDSLIPSHLWERIGPLITQTDESIHEFAKQVRIHPAIVAGRIRKLTGNYRLFNNLVGNGAVRKLFAN